MPIGEARHYYLATTWREPEQRMGPELGERLGVGRMAEVFAYGEGRVIKLARDAGHRSWLEGELAAQHAAAAAGITAPEAFEVVEAEGRPGLVMERVRGTDGLAVCEKQPWRIWAVSHRMGQLHRELSGIAAPPKIRSFVQVARGAIETSPRVPDRARLRLLALLDGLPDAGSLCHMDFHLGNIMIEGSQLTVIDFASSRRGDPVADHVESLLLFDISSPPEMTPWMRLLVLFGRKVARLAYVRGYGNLPTAEADRARRWWPVVIADRLHDGIPEERRPLLRLLSRKLREAEA